MTQPVSANFVNAALNSGTMIPIVQASIVLADNVTSGEFGTTATSTQDATIFPAAKAANGILTPIHKWAAADPFAEGSGKQTYLADGTFYPIDAGIEGGWWSSALSTTGGTMTTPQVLQVNYHGIINNQVTINFDPYLAYGVDFTIDMAYNLTSTVYNVNVVTVTGNTLRTYTIALPLPTNSSLLWLKLTITKISGEQQTAKVIEFGATLTADITKRIKSFRILRERQSDTATFEIGNSSAGELTMEIDNTDQLFSPYNTFFNAIYSGLLRANRPITIQAGYQYSDGTTELIPLGTFYTMEWDASGPSATTTIKAQDRMKRLRELTYISAPMSVNKSVDTLIASALVGAGYTPADYVLSTSLYNVPYAWADPNKTFYDYITTLAGAAGGAVYVDEMNRFRFVGQPQLGFSGSPPLAVSLTDLNAIISIKDKWSEGDLRNKFIVKSNAMNVAASAVVWSLQETLSVPASSSLSITVYFQNPCVNVTGGTLTAGAGVSISGLTSYAQSAVIVFGNSSGSAQNISGYTILGQALTNNGQVTAIAEDTALELQEGIRATSINNLYIQNYATALQLAVELLAYHKNSLPRIHVDSIGLPHLQLGDFINVVSTAAAINNTYILYRHEFTYDGGYHSAFDLISYLAT